jgi:hypothetical protein
LAGLDKISLRNGINLDDNQLGGLISPDMMSEGGINFGLGNNNLVGLIPPSSA